MGQTNTTSDLVQLETWDLIAMNPGLLPCKQKSNISQLNFTDTKYYQPNYTKKPLDSSVKHLAALDTSYRVHMCKQLHSEQHKCQAMIILCSVGHICSNLLLCTALDWSTIKTFYTLSITYRRARDTSWSAAARRFHNAGRSWEYSRLS